MNSHPSDVAMIRKQAEIISNHSKELDIARAKIKHLEELISVYKKSHEYYMLIQDTVMEHETAQTAWEDFMIVVRLCNDKDIKGMTC